MIIISFALGLCPTVVNAIWDMEDKTVQNGRAVGTVIPIAQNLARMEACALRNGGDLTQIV